MLHFHISQRTTLEENTHAEASKRKDRSDDPVTRSQNRVIQSCTNRIDSSRMQNYRLWTVYLSAETMSQIIHVKCDVGKDLVEESRVGHANWEPSMSFLISPHTSPRGNQWTHMSLKGLNSISGHVLTCTFPVSVLIAQGGVLAYHDQSRTANPDLRV